MLEKQTPVEKEWKNFLKREDRLIKRYEKQKEPFLDKKLQAVVPKTVSEKMQAAFYKAFQVILQNGTGVIEKTYSREKLETEYKVREYRHTLHATRKNLKEVPRTAGLQNFANVAGAGAEGAALGLLGIGLPDIPLFLGVIFRSLYTLALNYGIDYSQKEEQELLLKLIISSLNRGEGFRELDVQINRQLFEAAKEDRRKRKNPGIMPEAAAFAASEKEKAPADREIVRRAADTLSGELLYMKFLQGVPIAGVVGGIYDGIYLKKISDYAALKLERRYLLSKMEK